MENIHICNHINYATISYLSTLILMLFENLIKGISFLWLTWNERTFPKLKNELLYCKTIFKLKFQTNQFIHRNLRFSKFNILSLTISEKLRGFKFSENYSSIKLIYLSWVFKLILEVAVWLASGLEDAIWLANITI